MPDKLNGADFVKIGEWVKSELERRKGKRKGLEALWKEVDRQVSMTPLPREIKTGQKEDWFPNTELPLQANALEVIAADARRLKFPRGTDWYSVTAELTQDYQERYSKSKSILDGSEVNPDLDQESANTLVKATMDHFHKLYDFRSQIDLLDIEAIKYGTFVARVRPVNLAKTFERSSREIVGPAVIPSPIKSTYLDDSPQAVMHEGLNISPSVIRSKRQHLDALKKAASSGGPERGWVASQLRQLEPDKDRTLELIEIEGDILVPKSRGSIFLPNVILTIAVDSKNARPVRLLENPTPFRSYVTGYYMRKDVDSPYGVSPLMMGQPIQEAASLIFNELAAAAAINARPPVAYDRFDANLAAAGGPEIFPGAQWPTDSPNAIEVQEIGDVSALLNAYLALLKQYEDLTGVNDPRRGGPIKSHTSATGNELEATRGVLRTDDFVAGEEQGPITTILGMEYAIIKERMKSQIAVPINSGGINGWANISSSHLADRVSFNVEGSAGTLDKAQSNREFEAATLFALQLMQAGAQMGVAVPLKLQELVIERYTRAGINDATRFVGTAQDVSEGAETGLAVPGAGAPRLPLDLASLQGGRKSA